MSNLRPLPPTNNGFRYSWCEDDEPLCSRYINELNSVEATKRVSHASFKRKVIPTVVRLSDNDRAPQLKLEGDNNRVTGEKGYSMVRATHGVNRGKYYFEVFIDRMPENTASRIGWGQCYANLQAPLGYDHYGYSWRSRFGTKFHQARGKTFDKEGGYGEGDTIGCMIELYYGKYGDQTCYFHLPESVKEDGAIVPKKKEQSIKVMEEPDRPPSLSQLLKFKEENQLGGNMSFYKNGKLVGVAFEDILPGFYYPTISLYKSCTVTANFGPLFKYPPELYNLDSKNHINYKPAQAMAELSIIDNLISDLIFVIDKEAPQEEDESKNTLLEIVRNCVSS